MREQASHKSFCSTPTPQRFILYTKARGEFLLSMKVALSPPALEMANLPLIPTYLGASTRPLVSACRKRGAGSPSYQC